MELLWNSNLNTTYSVIFVRLRVTHPPPLTNILFLTICLPPTKCFDSYKIIDQPFGNCNAYVTKKQMLKNRTWIWSNYVKFKMNRRSACGWKLYLFLYVEFRAILCWSYHSSPTFLCTTWISTYFIIFFRFSPTPRHQRMVER